MSLRDVSPSEHTARRQAASGWRLGLDLPPRLVVSQWADDRRMIAAGTGPEPGRWRTDRTPYLREPMDVVCDPDVHTLVLEMSSQVGKTEVLVNIAGYFIDADPAPQMLVLPTLEIADSFSTKRFQPTIEASPALLDRIGRDHQRSTSTTIREKSYPGGDIVFAGANSPASLASRPRRVVLFDEIDKYKANIGKDGSPIKQGFQRTQNFWNAKKILASTPTVEGLSEIDAWYKKSDQRHFEVPCPHCGHFQALEWEQLDWPHRETSQARPDEARYLCAAEGCGTLWDQREIYLACRAGRWRARAPFNGIAGFRIWAIYSPWVSMADLAREWEDAFGKPEDEQTFINLKLGRVWSPTKESRTTPQMLLDRREDYGPEMLPPEVLLITAHVDVQGDRWEAQYIGWGVDDEKWVIDYQVLYGDTADVAQWELLDDRLLRREFAHPVGGHLPIEAIAIDAGHLQSRVMAFVRERREAFRPFYAVKGVGGAGRPLWRTSEEKFRAGARLHLSGVDDGKTLLWQELAAGPTPEEPHRRHRVHFPRHLELSYFEGLVSSERLRIDWVSGRPVRKWVPVSGRRNEPLDTFVGAMAVRVALSVDYAARRAQMVGERKVVDGARVAELFK